MKNQYKKIEKYYDEYSTWYDDERIDGYYSFINEIEIDVVRKYGIDKKILEVGCGTGIILDQTTKFAREAWGIDLSPEMVGVTRAKGLRARVASATKLPFKDNSFDVVYSFKVLAHIPDIETAIREIIRVVKPEGILILEFYNPTSMKHVTNKIMRSEEKVYTRFDNYSTIKRYLKSIKLESVRGARIFFPHAKLYTLPVIGNILTSLEKRASSTLLSRLAGYFIVVGRKRAY